MPGAASATEITGSARPDQSVGVLFDARVGAIQGYLARRLGSEVAEDATSEAGSAARRPRLCRVDLALCILAS